MGFMLHFYRPEPLVYTMGSAASVALKQIHSQRPLFQVAWLEGVTQP